MAKHEIHTVAREAARLLGAQIRAARLERGWTMPELAERAGVSRYTLLKVEHGDPSVLLGTALDCAALVGVPLFFDDEQRLRVESARTPLLPKRARPPAQPEVNLDF